ncbi:hypothetical protein MKX01_027384 [Papaver californicum]|nr:hypothetical protein MKX01_027384 [Papaver californicum]
MSSRLFCASSSTREKLPCRAKFEVSKESFPNSPTRSPLPGDPLSRSHQLHQTKQLKNKFRKTLYGFNQPPIAISDGTSGRIKTATCNIYNDSEALIVERFDDGKRSSRRFGETESISNG